MATILSWNEMRDRAVDAAYGVPKGFKIESERLKVPL